MIFLSDLISKKLYVTNHCKSVKILINTFDSYVSYLGNLEVFKDLVFIIGRLVCIISISRLVPLIMKLLVFSKLARLK